MKKILRGFIISAFAMIIGLGVFGIQTFDASLRSDHQEWIEKVESGARFELLVFTDSQGRTHECPTLTWD